MEAQSEKGKIETSVEIDIFGVSAAMVGVCITVIQLIQMSRDQKIRTITDEILAVDSILFLTSCFSAYFYLYFKNQPKQRRFFERLAHGTFLLGLSTIVVVCALMAYSFF